MSGRGWHASGVGTQETPEVVRELLESVASRLGLTHGRWVCELVFEDGRLVKLYRHEGPVTLRELEARFEG